MIYKVPCPTNTNGIRLFKEGNQIAIEYQKGAPHVSPMAYDSKLGKLGHTVTFEPKRKVARDAMPRPGIQHSKDIIMHEDPLDNTAVRRGIGYTGDDDDDDNEVVTKLMAYLNDKLTPEQLNGVAAILGSADDEDGDTSGEPLHYRGASDRAINRRRAARLAADVAYRRAPTAEENAEFDRMFPTAKLLKLR